MNSTEWDHMGQERIERNRMERDILERERINQLNYHQHYNQEYFSYYNYPQYHQNFAVPSYYVPQVLPQVDHVLPQVAQQPIQIVPPSNFAFPPLNSYDLHPYQKKPTPTIFNQYTFKRHNKSKSLPLNTIKKVKLNMGTITASSKLNYPINKVETTKDLKSVYSSIEVKKYSTNAIDPLRNYLTVYEYQINNHWVIWDYETGFVHLTGIWKAALCESNKEGISSSNLKADIVKLLESTPKQFHQYIKRIRGGFLKIQGTWLPYELCKILARRFCYHIRYELIPIFGLDFVDLCLKPNDYGYGELRLDDVARDHSDLSSLSIPQPPVPGREKHKRRRSTSVQRFPTERDRSMSNGSIYIILNEANYSGNKHESRSDTQVVESSTSKGAPRESSRAQFGERLKTFQFGGSIVSPEEDIREVPSTGDAVNTSADAATTPVGGVASDMIDIVNALRCLQSLRESASVVENTSQEGFRRTTPIETDATDSTLLVKSNDREPPSLEALPINYTAHQRNTSVDSILEESSYTVASVPYSSGGISTILLAAGMSEPKAEYRKGSMKITDLLT